MKFHSLRTSLAGSAFALLAALLLSSCGGSGAGSNFTSGNLLLAPTVGTMYAGVPYTFNIAGGRRPYRVVTSEQGLLPFPSAPFQGTSFTLVPNNPGVIDNTVQPGQLPVRSVVVSVFDAENNRADTSTMTVAQNFLTGYGLAFSSNCAVATGGTDAPPACAGGETLVRLTPTFNGTLVPNRTLRIDTLRGPITWIYPNGQVAGNSITLTSDDAGKAFAVFRADPGIPTQFVIFRVTDVETGMFVDQSLILTGVPIASQLDIIPDTFTFTGPDTATCGTGSAQFLVFDGVPPYKAVSSFAEVTVSPSSTTDQPGKFTFSVNNPNVCLSGATIIVTDSRLARGTVTIDTKAGTGTPPPAPLRAVPSSVTLSCAAPNSTVLIVGGDPTATLAAATNDPKLTAIAGTGNVQITFNPPTAGATDVPPVQTGVVNVTDGNSVVAIQVRHPTDCL